MTDAELTRLLVDCGLAAIGSTESLDDLKRRCGTRRWFDFADIIPLPPASLFPEQTGPFFVYPNRTCLLPATEFECDFDSLRDGPKNHACALERLTALFGTPRPGTAVNTLCETWTFERMSMTIRTFLKEKSGGRNDLYSRHPELWNVCRISIDRNWIWPMTDADAREIGSLGPHESLTMDGAFWPIARSMSMWERGLFRLANGAVNTPPGAPFFWKQANRVGWSAVRLSAGFARNRCIGLRLEQATPARGSGYSRLTLELRNPFSFEQEAIETELLRGENTNSLDRTAREVSAFWNLPMRTEKFADD